MRIYHITQMEDWSKAKEKGFYSAPSLEQEGFIHCSHRHQVCDTATRYYGGVHGLVLLEIETQNLSSRLLEEISTDNELFPHIYGRIDIEAVTRTAAIEPQPDGSFTFPLELG